MASAKDIVIKPITVAAANAIIKRLHYSGTFVRNTNFI